MSGYRLVVPAVWDRLDLAREALDGEIEALVARQFRGLDDQPLARARATAMLVEQAGLARAIGGLELHLSVRAVAGVVVPASLLVHVLPGGWAPQELARRLGQRSQAQVCDLPAGPAVRRIRRFTLGDGPARREQAGPAMVGVEYFFAVPGLVEDPVHLVLSGQTLAGPLEEAVVELFDTVAATLRWTGTQEVAA